MELAHITWTGPDMDDAETLARCPAPLQSVLTSVNGFIQFGGGLHLRGASLRPEWHSLRFAWDGPWAFHAHYPTVDPAWVPFAEDCVGDQFFLADEKVIRLAAETAELTDIAPSLAAFFDAIAADPVETLGLHPVLQHQKEAAPLEPGDLLLAYPPFVTKEAANGVALRAAASDEVHAFHADFAAKVSGRG